MNFKFSFSFFTAFLLIFSSCQKIDVVEIKSKDNIQEAKEWFENEFSENSKKIRIDVNEKKYEHKLLWENAFISKLNISTPLIVVPVSTKINGKKGNQSSVAWIYFNENSERSIKIVDFSLIDKNAIIDLVNFNGLMTIREFDGQLVDGYIFKNGKATGIIEKIDGEIPKWKKTKNGRIESCTVLYNISVTCISYAYITCVLTPLECSQFQSNGEVCFLNYSDIVDCSWAQNIVQSGGSPTTGFLGSPISAHPVTPGHRPLAIHNNKCDGIQDIWTKSITNLPLGEYNGVLTKNGQFLIT